MTERRPLATARLRLEPVAGSLADELWEATEGSLPELRPWMIWAESASPEGTREFAERSEREWEAGTHYEFALFADGDVVGAMGLHTHRPELRLADLGYWIRSDRAGRGYATEAGRALIDFGFSTLGLYRIELRAGVDNLASQRVAEKLGFRREGTLRQGCPHGLGGYDCYLYGLLGPR